MKNFTRLFKDESGVTAIEFGLIAALISVVCIGAMTTAGTQLNAVKLALATILLRRSAAAPRSIATCYG